MGFIDGVTKDEFVAKLKDNNRRFADRLSENYGIDMEPIKMEYAAAVGDILITLFGGTTTILWKKQSLAGFFDSYSTSYELMANNAFNTDSQKLRFAPLLLAG